MSGITRRQALGGGAVAAGAAAALAGCGSEEGERYPRKRIAREEELVPNEPLSFEYPLGGQQGVLLDLGVPVDGGAGRHESLVAFNIACQHMGCPVSYRGGEQRFVCSCHQTVYDPAKEGCVVQGVAQRPLPRIALEVEHGDVFATGVNGLIFGHRSNLARAS